MRRNEIVLGIFLLLVSQALLAGAHGAESGHWAYRPVSRPAVPEVDDSTWQKNPIDAFIFDKLDEAGLKPARPATKEVLIRRAYYNLTGLAPSPAEVRAFVEDASPRSYEDLLDHLLGSPRYGEQWGRHWLDLVRYADSNGYERDSDKPYIWRYRDYVIKAFNEDKAYDQFVREQLAGDELDEVTEDGIIATGYYRLGIWDDEPADRELARFDTFDGIVDTTSQVFMGLTAGCARCHDHKIDPMPQVDYYRMLAFFRGVTDMKKTEIVRSLLNPFEQKVYEQRVAAKRAKEDRLKAAAAEMEADFRVELAESDVEVDREKLRLSDLADLRYRLYRGIWDSLPEFDGMTPDESGPIEHNYVTTSAIPPGVAVGLVFHGKLEVLEKAEYTFTLTAKDGARFFINGKLLDEVSGLGAKNPPVKVSLKKGKAKFRLEYFNAGGDPVLKLAWSNSAIGIRWLSIQGQPVRPDASPQVAKYIEEGFFSKTSIAAYEQLREDLSNVQREKVPGRWAACVAEDGPTPPDTFVLRRGNPATPGDRVEPGFPSFLNAPDPELPSPREGDATSGRRRVLAEWIASDENPLTARVMVNRVWQYHFGRGIVRSPNNFGFGGDAPTHPELLNWLAAEFVEKGWKLKYLHRLIMTSETYRMSSAGNAAGLEADPGNDLFWRFNMRRLTGEEIRDSVLAASGVLNTKMGGPGFYPRLSEEILATSSQAQNIWGESPEEERTRRSVYIHLKRSLLLPLLTDFDLADTDSSCPVRFSTTQPAQALNMMNGDFVNEQAKRFAERLRAEAGDSVPAAVRLVLSVTLCRKPTAAEVNQGIEYMESMRREDGLGEEEALQRLCLLALNLNEFIFLD